MLSDISSHSFCHPHSFRPLKSPIHSHPCVTHNIRLQKKQCHSAITCTQGHYFMKQLSVAISRRLVSCIKLRGAMNNFTIILLRIYHKIITCHGGGGTLAWNSHMKLLDYFPHFGVTSLLLRLCTFMFD